MMAMSRNTSGEDQLWGEGAIRVFISPNPPKR